MKRLVLVASTALALILMPALAAVTLAGPDTGTNPGTSTLDPIILTVLNTLGDDTFSVVDLTTVLTDPNGTQHYGPFASGSPDSGTCGNNWAEDTFNREFTVRQSGPTTYSVVEQFKDGSFVTNAGPSPGGCDTDVGGTLVAGEMGSMHGYFIITVTGVQTSTSSACQATPGCTTAGFVESHFSAATYSVGTYFDHYSAGDQSLAFHEWKNASCDRGGNQGDIASTAGVSQPSLYCP